MPHSILPPISSTEPTASGITRRTSWPVEQSSRTELRTMQVGQRNQQPLIPKRREHFEDHLKSKQCKIQAGDTGDLTEDPTMVRSSLSASGVTHIGRPNRLPVITEQKKRLERYLAEKWYRIRIRGADLMDDPRRTTFLDLPAELRLVIYGLLLSSDPSCRCETCTRQGPKCCCARRIEGCNCQGAQHPELLAINRQIRGEAIAHLQKTTFELTLPSNGAFIERDYAYQYEAPGRERAVVSRAGFQRRLEAVDYEQSCLVETLTFKAWVAEWSETDRYEMGLARRSIGSGQVPEFCIVASYSSMLKDKFTNVRHIRFHFDFLLNYRLRDAQYKNLATVLHFFPKLETIHLQLHVITEHEPHDWLPKSSDVYLEKFRITIHRDLDRGIDAALKTLPERATTASPRKVDLKTEVLYRREPPNIDWNDERYRNYPLYVDALWHDVYRTDPWHLRSIARMWI